MSKLFASLLRGFLQRQLDRVQTLLALDSRANSLWPVDKDQLQGPKPPGAGAFRDQMVEAVGSRGAVHDFPCRAGTDRATLSLLYNGEDLEGYREQTWVASWPL